MSFHFTVPWFLQICGEILFEFAVLLSAGTATVFALKRILIAWRDRRLAPMVTTLSRTQLLNDGLPILSLSDAKKVGRARDVILDLPAGRVAGFRAKTGLLTDRLLPFDQVKAIGPDAITVESASTLSEPNAVPSLQSLAAEKYNRTECEVITESGTHLGELSWRDIRFHVNTGEVQIVLRVRRSSFPTHLLDLLFDVVSVFQPLNQWSSDPWRLELTLPLRAVLKVNRNLVIVTSQAEADCRDQQQAALNHQQERLKNSRAQFQLALARAWRHLTGKAL